MEVDDAEIRQDSTEFQEDEDSDDVCNFTSVYAG